MSANPYLGRTDVRITRAEVRRARKFIHGPEGTYPRSDSPDHDLMLRFWATHNARCKARRQRRETAQAVAALVCRIAYIATVGFAVWYVVSHGITVHIGH